MDKAAADPVEAIRALEALAAEFEGEIFTDYDYRLLYATDASAYREVPLAIARPRHKEDILRLIRLASEHRIGLIPRTAGTSLAGQVVGGGIMVDVSRYMTRVLEVNAAEHWVRVEPGVILDELNKLLQPLGLFFGPETSTSNRCMIGGMVGNNSCGAHSLVYGSTRDHTLEITALLSDGSEVRFADLNPEALGQKCRQDDLEGKVYKTLFNILNDKDIQKSIREEYPDPSIHRRNTGYALDLLLDCAPFTPGGPPFNLCRLLAGSEGTLAITTEVKLNLVPLPPPATSLVCVHCRSLDEAFRGNLIALKHHPEAVELMDRVVMEQTRHNIEQRRNRFFIQGEPEAMLIVEFAGHSQEELETRAQALEEEMRALDLGYHFPRIYGGDIKKVWNLRKAGLGLLSNIPGDAKPVAVIEDTAVSPEQLPDYMRDFQELLERLEMSCVYYAHIATGELHLRPVLNLKDPRDVERFHTVALETARLVKKYRGSLSGEHGDGRLRGQFIPLMLGDRIYELLREVKATWDPQGLYNPGKITDTPAMTSSLRYEPGRHERQIHTHFDFSSTQGILRAVEQCNGSGDCRKTELSGGTMCPSYMATREEHTTTRARANILREFLTHSPGPNPFDHQEIFDVMDLCLSCKGCKSECPSNVDMARYKAEFLQHYLDSQGLSLRTRAIAYIATLHRLASVLPAAYNFVVDNGPLSAWVKRTLGFAQERSLPRLNKIRFKRWLRRHNRRLQGRNFPNGRVWIFADEFTEFLDGAVGRKAVLLLNALGYRTELPPHVESGRTFLSKGLVRKAAQLARRNVELLHPLLSASEPLIGVEPSAILSFRDEYPDLVGTELQEAARTIAPYTLMIDEFIMREAAAGRIRPEAFTDRPLSILLHGH
ncbi:MAG TPA: FAD-binding and (Fe-S)-binding domain-containing protein, partial [Bacteroidales bacterium]|nr:FAD-binding and (Fe-S)-binding domain-containing protein [Bacteroidales bacterium]